MAGGKKKKKINGQGKINMSLYEMNKSLISQLPQYTEDQLKELENKISAKFPENKHFMLLCREINHYTVFSHSDNPEYENLGKAVVDVICSFATIHSNEECEDHFEIWAKLKNNNETYVFLLFPYDMGVITYG